MGRGEFEHLVLQHLVLLLLAGGGGRLGSCGLRSGGSRMLGLEEKAQESGLWVGGGGHKRSGSGPGAGRLGEVGVSR